MSVKFSISENKFGAQSSLFEAQLKKPFSALGIHDIFSHRRTSFMNFSDFSLCTKLDEKSYVMLILKMILCCDEKNINMVIATEGPEM